MAPLSKFLLCFGAFAAVTLSAQSLQLKRADRFTVVNSYGRSVTKLRGNVKLASAEGVFTCDSADWFRGENRFWLTELINGLPTSHDHGKKLCLVFYSSILFQNQSVRLPVEYPL